MNKDLDKDLQREEKFIQTLLGVVKDKRGLKHTLQFSKEYILNYLIARGVLSDDREQLIKELRMNTNYEAREVMELVNNYFRFKEALPEYNLIQNQKIDEASERYGTQFEKVGRKVLGIINKGNRQLCVDVSGLTEVILAEINNGGIQWKHNGVSTPEMKWIIDNTKHRMGISL